jgi:hypothetical protein
MERFGRAGEASMSMRGMMMRMLLGSAPVALAWISGRAQRGAREVVAAFVSARR